MRREKSLWADFLRGAGIQTLIHYPIAADRQECCKNVSSDPLGLAKAEAHAEQCLSLPCHPQLRDDEVNKSSRQLMSSSDHRCYCVNLLFTMTTALFTRQAVSKDS